MQRLTFPLIEYQVPGAYLLEVAQHLFEQYAPAQTLLIDLSTQIAVPTIILTSINPSILKEEYYFGQPCNLNLMQQIAQATRQLLFGSQNKMSCYHEHQTLKIGNHDKNDFPIKRSFK